ncbi:MAG TPA: histidine kinase dimerization/phospho-acceptor domain-containing protein, partial [Bacteroidota bacterium]
MRKLAPLAILTVALDLLILCICVLHLPSVAERAKVPFEVSEDGDRVTISSIIDASAAHGLKQGDEITAWNSQPVRDAEYLEFCADRESIGASAVVDYRRNAKGFSSTVTLVPYYPSLRFVIITAFVGLAFWLIGVYVLLNRPDEHAAGILHWCIILMSATIFLTQGNIVQGDGYSVFARELFLIVYPMAGAMFLYFSTLFPLPKLGRKRIKATVIISSAVFISAFAALSFLAAIRTGGAAAFHTFQMTYDVCHALLLFYGFGTVASMIHSYLVARTREERQKLEWIMWGFVVGPTPFIALIIVPELLLSNDLVPEEFATLFMVVVPLTLAISFLKYRILDIGVLINRSVVYAVLTMFIGAVYIAAVFLLTSAIGGRTISDELLFVIALSLTVAIVLNPLRQGVQRFVNTTLFPARMKYRESVKAISTEIASVLSTDQLFRIVISIVGRMLPVSKAAVYQYVNGMMMLQNVERENLVARFALSEKHAAEVALPRIYALPSAVSFHRPDVDVSREELLRKLGFSVGMPLLNESGTLLGMLLVNPRIETKRFDEGEIDLFSTIVRESEEALDRLQLQEKLILEREEKRHAEELNRLKSYFVSSVSHELRTPLTSIRMFADTLRDNNGTSARRRKEYLDIIVGESERLARLINNILDFSKIERGIKEFHFAKINFLEVVKRSLAAMRYQIEMEDATIRVRMPKTLPAIIGDNDALEEVIMNLLSNALKYSLENKDISVNVRTHAHHVLLAVADKGLGIS